jgi:hypothetical protein
MSNKSRLQEHGSALQGDCSRLGGRGPSVAPDGVLVAPCTSPMTSSHCHVPPPETVSGAYPSRVKKSRGSHAQLTSSGYLFISTSISARHSIDKPRRCDQMAPPSSMSLCPTRNHRSTWSHFDVDNTTAARNRNCALPRGDRGYVSPCLIQIERCLFLRPGSFSAVDLEAETRSEADNISRLSTLRYLLFVIKQCGNQCPQTLSSKSSQFS